MLTLRPQEENEPHFHEMTGIYVRAVGYDGKYGAYDIAELSKESLLEWLRSRGGDNMWAENVVGIMLGHEQLRKE